MDKFRIVKYTAYGLEIIIAFIIQTTPYLLPEVFGGKAILLIPLALSVSVFEKEIPSMIFGAVCGLLEDCSYGGTIGFYSISLVVTCYVVSVLTENYIRTNLLTAMLASFFCIPAIISLQFVFYYIFMGYTNISGFFVKHYLSRIFYTLAFMPVFYILNRQITVRLSRFSG